jgi:cytochrome c-type biogenesis protein CcmH/NrfG
MTDWKSVVVPLVLAVALLALVGWALYGLLDAWQQLARMAVR